MNKENGTKGNKTKGNKTNLELLFIVQKEYEELTKILIEKKLSISTMESCTGGLVSSLITDTEGASACVKGSLVTYCNEEKIAAGVSASIIDKYGVYSKETACEMARVTRIKYGSDIGIGVTGSFGNVDLNNNDSIPSEEYFAIDFNGVTESFFIINEEKGRFNSKLYLCHMIYNELVKRVVKKVSED